MRRDLKGKKVDEDGAEPVSILLFPYMQLVMEPCTILMDHTHGQTEFSVVASGKNNNGTFHYALVAFISISCSIKNPKILSQELILLQL
jgi:hypothetical protein